jgi:hypothetical protein
VEGTQTDRKVTPCLHLLFQNVGFRIKRLVSMVWRILGHSDVCVTARIFQLKFGVGEKKPSQWEETNMLGMLHKASELKELLRDLISYEIIIFTVIFVTKTRYSTQSECRNVHSHFPNNFQFARPDHHFLKEGIFKLVAGYFIQSINTFPREDSFLCK